LRGGNAVVESEKIKQTIKDVCKEEGHKELSTSMIKILDYLRNFPNTVAETRDPYVKYIISKMEEIPDENS